MSEPLEAEGVRPLTPPPHIINLEPFIDMKKETIKQIIQIIVTILTAISSTLFVQSCM